MTDVDILEVELGTLEYDSILQAAKSLRKEYKECLSELSRREEEVKRLKYDQRVSSFPSSTSSSNSQCSWIRAELDSPSDTSFSCFHFRERSKYPIVAVYDESQSSLEARSRETLQGERAVIYSRLPSRRSKAIHVFVECITPSGGDAARRFRISTNNCAPPGFDSHLTIHLERLSWETRAKIWTGRIKWLYILHDIESPKASASDQQQEKK